MKLAFLISAHTDPEHLKRLILSLPEDAVFVVHIDAKSDISAFTIIHKTIEHVFLTIEQAA